MEAIKLRPEGECLVMCMAHMRVAVRQVCMCSVLVSVVVLLPA
jgi:hypothetical protein